MIYTFIVLQTILFIIGFYRLVIGFFNPPSNKMYDVAKKITKISIGISPLEKISNDISLKIAKYIPINSLRYEKIQLMLKYSENKIKEPRLFIANNIVKSMMFTVPGIILIPILPIATFGIFLIAAILFYKEMSSIETIYQKRKQEIEWELPRFCSIINQEVKSTHDVLGILSRYSKSTNKALSRELTITIADMNSSNYESALKRLESRLSIDKLAEIIRGLISTIRGDDTRNYFEMLSHDMDALELQRLTDEANKQPDKVSKYQLIVLILLFSNYVLIFALWFLSIEKPF